MKVQNLEVKELQPKVQKKKVLKLKVMEKEIRKSNPIVILGGNVDLWIAGVLIKKITTASGSSSYAREFTSSITVKSTSEEDRNIRSISGEYC